MTVILTRVTRESKERLGWHERSLSRAVSISFGLQGN